MLSLTKGTDRQIGRQINHPPKVLVVSMESLVMRNRLQVSFWGLHLTAEGIVAINAALAIVIALLAASNGARAVV
jgi:hypothetical protein